MKVLQINAFHYLKGGSEKVYFNTARLLREHGHAVVDFALKWEENLQSPFSDYFPDSKQTRRGPLRPLANMAAYFYHRQAARNLDRLLREQKPDVAQIHLIWGQLTPSILKVLNKHKVPTILTAHDYRLVCPAYLFMNGKGEMCEACEGHKFINCLRGRCCKGSLVKSVLMAAEQQMRNSLFPPARLAQGIIYVSEFSRSKHEQYMPELKSVPAQVIYNFTPVDERDREPGEKYFLYFGRLSKEKGVETFIEAARQMPSMKFKVVGTGPLLDPMQQLAREAGLQNIEFTGYKSGDELASLVRNAYFTVVPSRWYENNPLAIVESYASGTPVIGARIGGIPEIIQEGTTGYIFESGDVSSLLAAMNQAASLYASQYDEMRENARLFAKKNFSPESYYSRLMEFYKSVIEDESTSTH